MPALFRSSELELSRAAQASLEESEREREALAGRLAAVEQEAEGLRRSLEESEVRSMDCCVWVPVCAHSRLPGGTLLKG